MELINWLAVFSSALVPLIVGFVWYGPLFGKAWMRLTGLTEEKMKGANMAVIFGLTYVLSVVAALGLYRIVVHEFYVYSMFAKFPGLHDVTTEAGKTIHDFLTKAGDGYRTFKHGAYHGLLFCIMVVFPLLTINGLFERKSWNYIFLHTGFWAVTLLIMGGILSVWV